MSPHAFAWRLPAVLSLIFFLCGMLNAASPYAPDQRIVQSGNPHYGGYGNIFDEMCFDVNYVHRELNLPVDMLLVCGQIARFDSIREFVDFRIAADTLLMPWRSVAGEDDRTLPDPNNPSAPYDSEPLEIYSSYTGFDIFHETTIDDFIQIIAYFNYYAVYKSNDGPLLAYSGFNEEQFNFIEDKLISENATPWSVVFAPEGWGYGKGNPKPFSQEAFSPMFFENKLSIFMWGSSGSTNSQNSGPNVQVRESTVNGQLRQMLDIQTQGPDSYLVHEFYGSDHLSIWNRKTRDKTIPKRWDFRYDRSSGNLTLLSVPFKLGGLLPLPGIGRFEAEEHDLSLSSVTGVSRPTDANGSASGLSTVPAEPGNSVKTGLAAGKWLIHSAQVTTGGNYDWKLRYSSPAGATVRLLQNGLAVAGNVTLPASASLRDSSAAVLPLTIGYSKLKLEVVSGALELDRYTLVRSGLSAQTPAPVLQTPSGSYSRPLANVSFAPVSAGTAIYYTTGDKPLDEFATRYTGPFILPAGGEVRAIAVRSGQIPSSVANTGLSVQYDVPAGLIANYTFQQKASASTVEINDFSGNPYNAGKPLGVPTLTPGVFDQAIRFSGSGGDTVVWEGIRDFSSLPSVHGNAFTSRSWSVWIRPDATNRLQYLYSDDERAGRDAINFYLSSDGRINFSIGIQSDKMLLSHPWPDQGGSWHHVAGTFINGSAKLWLNGVEVGSDSRTFTQIGGRTFNYETDTLLGAGPEVGKNLYAGAIDDFRIYDRPLTAGEVSQLSTLNGGGVPTNMAPTAISLSATSLDENKGVGTIVGTLGTVDSDDGDTHTYTLVSGDTAAFSISGNQLRAAAVFDFEAKSGYSVKVRTTDSGGLFFERTFGITVNNLDEVTIYENWVGSVNWGTASLAERAKGSDPDGDGLSNELEWLLGYSPVARNPSLKFLQSVANMSDGGKTARIAYPKASPESSIYLLQSPNLSAWSLSTPAIPTYESGSGLYVHNVSIPAGHGRMFFKLSSSPTVSAARQADDSFRIPENYAQGNLAGQSGGRGWSGAWSVTASEFFQIETAQADPTGLVFPGLATSGGGIRLEAATRPHRAIRQLQSSAGTQETWVAWLQLDSEQYRTSGLELLSGSDVAAQVEMVRTAGFEMTVGNSSVATGGNPFSSLAYLCILKIDPVAKKITFWKSRSDAPMNLTAAPAPADGISLTLPNGFSFDQISFFGGAYSTDRFDEIRVGSSFTAVVAE